MDYKPINVRALLTEMKNISDLTMDLSFASLLFEDRELAQHVRELEGKMDSLMYQIRTMAAAAARGIKEASKITGILQVAGAAEYISNATGDMVDLILRGMKIHQALKDGIALADEKLHDFIVAEGAMVCGKKLSELRLPSTMGVWILALKRGDEWLISPSKDTEIMAGDRLIAKGPLDGIERVCELAGVEYGPHVPSRRLRRIRSLLSEMRDISSVGVDLAYCSFLLGLREPAEQVRELEEEFDRLNYELWLDTLKAAKRERDVEGLNSILQVVKCMEKISDAADLIVDVVLRGMELHPVFAEALAEADEKIARVEVSEIPPFSQRTLGELDLWTTMGVYVLMVKRGDKYIFDPGRKFRLQPHDLVVIRGPYAGIEKAKTVASLVVRE